MRNPGRIDKFCDELKTIWRKVPDWRFGQLMENMLGARLQAVQNPNGFFYTEDEELFAFFENYIKEIVKNGRQSKDW